MNTMTIPDDASVHPERLRFTYPWSKDPSILKQVTLTVNYVFSYKNVYYLCGRNHLSGTVKVYKLTKMESHLEFLDRKVNKTVAPQLLSSMGVLKKVFNFAVN